MWSLTSPIRPFIRSMKFLMKRKLTECLPFSVAGFQEGYQQGPMELVDIYQILTHQLGIEPRPHNGTWSTVEAMVSPAAALSGAAALIQVALVVLAAAAVIWA